VAPEAAEIGFDWYLCGHTHGGQIRLPLIGALFSSSRLGRRFVMGRYTVGKLQLYVTRGVGMEGLGAPRARFLCPPEIVLWEIRGS
jgi:predicted MPP superfamily phosphohydrolase